MPVANNAPSGLNATSLTQSANPEMLCRMRPSATDQRLSVLSLPPEASTLPAALNATHLISSVWPSNVRRAFPSATFQSVMVLFQLPAATMRPSGLNATLVNAFDCPGKSWSLRPSATTRNLRLLSAPPDASNLPSGLNAIENGISIMPSCNILNIRPFATCRSVMPPKPLDDASKRLSGLKLTLASADIVPAKIRSLSFFRISQTLIVWSLPLEIRRVPSGLNATHETAFECC